MKFKRKENKMPNFYFPQLNSPEFLVIYWTVFAAVILFLLVERWKLMTKLYLEGWKSLIPIYGEFLLWQHTWSGGFYFLHLLFSVAGSVLLQVAGGNIGLLLGSLLCFLAALCLYARKCLHTARAFGHGAMFAFGLLLFPGFFDGILAFSFDPYLGNVS